MDIPELQKARFEQWRLGFITFLEEAISDAVSDETSRESAKAGGSGKTADAGGCEGFTTGKEGLTDNTAQSGSSSSGKANCSTNDKSPLANTATTSAPKTNGTSKQENGTVKEGTKKAKGDDDILMGMLMQLEEGFQPLLNEVSCQTEINMDAVTKKWKKAVDDAISQGYRKHGIAVTNQIMEVFQSFVDLKFSEIKAIFTVHEKCLELINKLVCEKFAEAEKGFSLQYLNKTDEEIQALCTCDDRLSVLTAKSLGDMWLSCYKKKCDDDLTSIIKLKNELRIYRSSMLESLKKEICWSDKQLESAHACALRDMTPVFAKIRNDFKNKVGNVVTLLKKDIVEQNRKTYEAEASIVDDAMSVAVAKYVELVEPKLERLRDEINRKLEHMRMASLIVDGFFDVKDFVYTDPWNKKRDPLVKSLNEAFENVCRSLGALIQNGEVGFNASNQNSTQGNHQEVADVADSDAGADEVFDFGDAADDHDAEGGDTERPVPVDLKAVPCGSPVNYSAIIRDKVELFEMTMLESSTEEFSELTEEELVKEYEELIDQTLIEFRQELECSEALAARYLKKLGRRLERTMYDFLQIEPPKKTNSKTSQSESGSIDTEVINLSDSSSDSVSIAIPGPSQNPPKTSGSKKKSQSTKTPQKKTPQPKKTPQKKRKRIVAPRDSTDSDDRASGSESDDSTKDSPDPGVVGILFSPDNLSLCLEVKSNKYVLHESPFLILKQAESVPMFAETDGYMSNDSHFYNMYSYATDPELTKTQETYSFTFPAKNVRLFAEELLALYFMRMKNQIQAKFKIDISKCKFNLALPTFTSSGCKRRISTAFSIIKFKNPTFIQPTTAIGASYATTSLKDQSREQKAVSIYFQGTILELALQTVTNDSVTTKSVFSTKTFCGLQSSGDNIFTDLENALQKLFDVGGASKNSVSQCNCVVNSTAMNQFLTYETTNEVVSKLKRVLALIFGDKVQISTRPVLVGLVPGLATASFNYDLGTSVHVAEVFPHTLYLETRDAREDGAERLDIVRQNEPAKGKKISALVAVLGSRMNPSKVVRHDETGNFEEVTLLITDEVRETCSNSMVDIIVDSQGLITTFSTFINNRGKVTPDERILVTIESHCLPYSHYDPARERVSNILQLADRGSLEFSEEEGPAPKNSRVASTSANNRARRGRGTRGRKRRGS